MSGAGNGHAIGVGDDHSDGRQHAADAAGAGHASAVIVALGRESVAANLLLNEFSAIIADDEEFRNDLIDGQTGLFESFDVVLARLVTLSTYKAAINEQLAFLQARRSRFEKQEDGLRSLMFRCMEICNLKKIERAAATISRKKLPRRLEPYDTALIPDRFVKIERRLDKSSILAAIKTGEEIPGARVVDAGETISILFR